MPTSDGEVESPTAPVCTLDQTATWNSHLGPKLESQYQVGNMNCGGQEKGTLPSQYCHKIMTLLLFRKITFL